MGGDPPWFHVMIIEDFSFCAERSCYGVVAYCDESCMYVFVECVKFCCGYFP